MRHVVYRSDGVALVALGAAKKIDLTAPETGRWPFVTKEGDLAEIIDTAAINVAIFTRSSS
jgi:hypothetical protein